MNWRLTSLLAAGLLIGQLALTASAQDFQFALGANGLQDWRLGSVSSSKIFSGPLPANDPPINLIVGKRYRVTNTLVLVHIFQIVAASELGDNILLSEGLTSGPLESDPIINWTDDGLGHVEFTVTQTLVDMLRSGNSQPMYRCGIHSLDMRGNLRIFGDGTRILDPIPAPIVKGKQRIELQSVITGLVSPLGLTSPDDGSGLMYVWDQAGRIALLSLGAPLGYDALDVSNRLVPLDPTYDERGLLGFAIHPNFATNQKFYTYTSEPVAGPADFTVDLGGGTPDHQAVIAEWSIDPTLMGAIDPTTRRELLRIDEPQSNHNGGTLRFGHDGKLYIALGDGGNGDDEVPGHGADGNGQNKNTVYGKILRIDIDGNNSANGQYGIPADNPFVGVDGVDEIYAYGLRNPYSFSFDTADPFLLYAGDVGQNDVEEVDIVFAGGNYGWRIKEGSFFFDPNGSNDGFVTTVPVEPVPSVTAPIAEYDHSEGEAIVGGFVYRGTAIPGLAGRYVTGDYSGRLFYIDQSGQIVEFLLGSPDRPFGMFLKGFGQDDQNEQYVCASTEAGPGGTTGTVFKIIAAPLENAVGASWELYN